VRVTSAAVAVAFVLAVPGGAAAQGDDGHGDGLKKVDRVVVIYQENHSFDNLYGGWEGVNGVDDADAAHTTQVNQAGTPYTCLLQVDVNLTSPPLPATCHDETTETAFDSAFANEPFTIDDFIAPTDTTCPPPGASAPNGTLKGTGLPGGCTRDLVHRFYQEQYQLNDGAQNRYVTGSDAVGLAMGVQDTRQLPIYRYLHSPGHPRYAIADNFFQSAFGGSFLNHQWLVAAATPTFPGAPDELHSVLDANGMPANYPLYASPAGTAVRDTALTAACGGSTPAGLACGDYAVNTIQPPYQPFSSPTATKLPPQTAPTIGDRLSDEGIDWAWYSGGWSNANGDIGAPGWTNGDGPTCSDPNAATTATFPNCPDKLFQYHHQPLNYFASFAPGT
jgi:acid phosphatase